MATLLKDSNGITVADGYCRGFLFIVPLPTVTWYLCLSVFFERTVDFGYNSKHVYKE